MNFDANAIRNADINRNANVQHKADIERAGNEVERKG